jgi:hypothetical protein
MNAETIYNVLLDQPRQIDGKTWHGFSYQLTRDEAGKVEVREHGWPTTLTIYEADGPELDALTEAQVKAAIEAALPVDESYVIPPPPVPFVPTYTASEWVDQQQFTGNRTTTMLYLKLQLDAAGKSSPKLAAVQAWLDQLIVAGVTAPDERRTAEAWTSSPYSFEQASQEALQVLNS